MAIKTISYSPSAEGWTSFYSFQPETMVGLNNRFYTVKNGKLYQHDVVNGNNYAQFYGVDYQHYIEFIINDSPSANLLFKTIKIEGNSPYDVLIETDIQSTGFIEKDWFEEKEGAWYAFIRNSGTTPAQQDEYALRRVGGLGKSLNYFGSATEKTVTFPNSVNLGVEMSIGDALYFAAPPYTDPIYGGIVTDIQVDKPNNINRVVFNNSVAGSQTLNVSSPFIFFAKNSVAESQGVLGHYAKIKLSKSDNTSMSEIFSVEPEVMASYT